MVKAKKTTKAVVAKKNVKGAIVAKKANQTPKGTKPAAERATAQANAPVANKEKRLGILSAAVLVLKDANAPMNAKEMVDAAMAKGMWSTKGKTPAATLYAAIIREIAKKGSDARFQKTDRGQFALNT